MDYNASSEVRHLNVILYIIILSSILYNIVIYIHIYIYNTCQALTEY